MKTTWGNWYWPLWLAVMTLSLLGPEIYALFTNVQNTQSYWVWHRLNVATDGSAKPWTWVHYLALCFWLSIQSWLTFHYFFGRFR